MTVVIPQRSYANYPLLTPQAADFRLFKMAAIDAKAHRTLEGLLKIVATKASINKGLSETLTKAFPNIIDVQRPLISTKVIPSSGQWAAAASKQASKQDL
jgi:hypothetical protein